MLLNIPSVVKGVPAIITLNKSELFSLSAISNDTFFSIESNVKSCLFEFTSNPGNQTHVLIFNLLNNSLTSKICLSTKARDLFELSRIILIGKENDVFFIEKNQIPFQITIIPTSAKKYFSFEGDSDGAGFSGVMNEEIGGEFF
jgi:hypothetical protein